MGGRQLGGNLLVGEESDPVVPIRGEGAQGTPAPVRTRTRLRVVSRPERGENREHPRARGISIPLTRGSFVHLATAVDLFAVVAGVTIAVGGWHGMFSLAATHRLPIALPMLMFVFVTLRGGGAAPSRAHGPLLEGLLQALGLLAMATLTVGAMMMISSKGGASTLMLAWALSSSLLIFGRLIVTSAYGFAAARGFTLEPVLIVGAGEVGQALAKRLLRERQLRPIGFLDDEDQTPVETEWGSIPVLAPTSALCHVAAQTGVRRVVVAFTRTPDSVISEIIRSAHQASLHVSVVPRMFDSINDRCAYETAGGMPLLSFARPKSYGIQLAVKHALDRCAALLLIVFAAPVLIALTVAVKRSSPGPILFRQRRVGLDGRTFELYKFRSMRVDASEASSGSYTPASGSAPGGVEGIDRRTRVGTFMRRTSLDELPQLFNVLKGDMSLVGPRPERPEYVQRFETQVRRYAERHRMKSGVTGWAQINGLRGQTSLADRIAWDNYYIEHWSMWMDLNILLRTPLAACHGTE